MLRNTLAILVHLLPLVPLALGHKAAFGAAALIVLALYVKDRKLGAMERALLDRVPSPKAKPTVDELASLRAARKRWQYLQLPGLRDVTAPSAV